MKTFSRSLAAIAVAMVFVSSNAQAVCGSQSFFPFDLVDCALTPVVPVVGAAGAIAGGAVGAAGNIAGTAVGVVAPPVGSALIGTGNAVAGATNVVAGNTTSGYGYYNRGYYAPTQMAGAGTRCSTPSGVFGPMDPTPLGTTCVVPAVGGALQGYVVH
jgi:hypothetical protein